MAVVLTVAKGATSYDFDEYEVPKMIARRRQPGVTQGSFTGNLSVVYTGEARYEFVITFSIGRGGALGTLQKLDQIFQWRDSFTLSPFVREGGATYTVIWPPDLPFEETLVYGYAEAMNAYEVTWLEKREETCAGDDDLFGKNPDGSEWQEEVLS